jgi:hypothetical protein
MRDGGFVNLLKASPVWPTRAMNTPATPNRYKHHRFPGEIISHGVWLYDRFYLSYRDVEELLFERGVIVTYEAIRTWCRKFHIPPNYVVERVIAQRKPPEVRICRLSIQSGVGTWPPSTSTPH